MAKPLSDKTLLINKRVNYDFELLEKIEAGISLHGFEVKSLRKKQGSLAGSYVTLSEAGAYLQKAYIPPYQEKNVSPTFDPYRVRPLLLHKKEIRRLMNKEKEKSTTIVPISMYLSHGLVKVKIALAKGKKKSDKRETLKKRDQEREINKDFKQNIRF